MKILMVHKFLYPNGGSETYIFELAKYSWDKVTEETLALYHQK